MFPFQKAHITDLWHLIFQLTNRATRNVICVRPASRFTLTNNFHHEITKKGNHEISIWNFVFFSFRAFVIRSLYTSNRKMILKHVIFDQSCEMVDVLFHDMLCFLAIPLFYGNKKCLQLLKLFAKFNRGKPHLKPVHGHFVQE